MRYCISVDLGGQMDHTAITMLRREERLDEPKTLPGTWERESEEKVVYSVYEVPFIERLPLGTPFAKVTERVKTLLDMPSLFRRQVSLVVDATGLGMPVLQQMRSEGLAPLGVVITSGNSVTEQEVGYGVPKKNLVTALQVVLQTQRLRISPKLEYADALRQEMQHFHASLTQSNNLTMEAESGFHDDLIMSLAMGIWHMEQSFGYRVTEPVPLNKETYDPLRIIRNA